MRDLSAPARGGSLNMDGRARLRRHLKPEVVSSSESTGEDKLSESYHDDAVTSLKASLRSLKSKLPFAAEEREGVWKNCIETVKKEIVRKQDIKINERKCNYVKAFCRKGFKWLTLLLLILIFIGVFLYLCKPASFFLQRKIHSRLYQVSRLVRKSLLVLHPYLHAFGINVFSSCILKNPFIHTEKCPSAKDINEQFSGGHTVPMHILEGARSGEWWTIRSALNISTEVTVQTLHQFSMENNGQFPTICDQIVGGGEDSKGTVFYTDLFNVRRMEEALKSPVPWSLSWVECPDVLNTLSIRSLFPSLSYLPQHVAASKNALISLSTEWSITLHYQNGLPSTLLSLVVMKGELRIIPVILEKEHCQEMHRVWQNPLLLKKGDAVILDHRHWSYEVQTWSSYSITLTSSIIMSEHAI